MAEKEKLGNRLIGVGVALVLLAGIGWAYFATQDNQIEFNLFSKLVFAGMYDWPDFPGVVAFFLAVIRIPLLIVGVIAIISGIALKAYANSSVSFNPVVVRVGGIILIVLGVAGFAAFMAGLYLQLDSNTEFVYQAQWQMGGGSLTITDMSQDTYDGLLGWCIENYKTALAVGGSLLAVGVAALATGGKKQLSGASWMVSPDGQPWINTWVQHDGKSYYFNNSGNLLSSCWIEWNGKQYYICAEGYCTESRTV